MNFFANIFSEIILFINSGVGSIGLSIIIFTLLIRSLLLPLTLPSIKSNKKIKELQPEIDKLKKKHKGDQQALAMAQSQLYKAYNVNPISGCLPQLLQFFFLIELYNTIRALFSDPTADFNFMFLGADLSQPDKRYIFPIVAGLSQFLLSLMISPATKTPNKVPDNSPFKKVQEANAKEEDVAEMASMMQQQMVFMMPLMTAFIALRLPSGLALYWITGTFFTMVTQAIISGWGGLATYWNKWIAKGALAKFALTETRTEAQVKKGTFKVESSKNKSKITKKGKKNDGLASVLLKMDGADTAPKAKNTRASKKKTNIKKNRTAAKKARKTSRKK
jgi:YidC/Oxa1 family membrane protein insertase